MTYEEKNWLIASRDNMFDLHLLVPDGLHYGNVIQVVEFPNVIYGEEVLKPVWKEDLTPHHHQSGKAWKIFMLKAIP